VRWTEALAGLAVLAFVLACAPGPSALVVLTHPDDELAIVDYLWERGPEAGLLFLTRGESAEHPEGRSEEAEVARAVYGSRSVELLEAPAGSLRLDPTDPWNRWNVEELVDEVARRIDASRPSEVVTWMPSFPSVHGEHQVTGAVVTAACLKARHRPERILYAFESSKVGYYRMRGELLTLEELGLEVRRFRADSLPYDRLSALYPSQGAHRWLGVAEEAYRDGSRLVSVPVSGVSRPLEPPRAATALPPGSYRVLPHFGPWLESVGLERLSRIVALLPPAEERPEDAGGVPLDRTFDDHELRREFRDGVLYLLLPRDVLDAAALAVPASSANSWRPLSPPDATARRA